MIHKKHALFTAIAPLILCGTAQAQSDLDQEIFGIEEIVVTAERRLSTAQDTAASVSVRSGEDMLTQGRFSLESILEDVPGIVGGIAENSGSSQSAGADNAARGLTIRGIKSNVGVAGSTVTTASAAAIYVDDVYNGIGGGYDLERLEVLRGPQGTLYGRSATSGVVAIRTRAPDTEELNGYVSVEGGDYDLNHISGGVNIPLAENKAALRISANSYERDSYFSTNGGGQVDNSDGRVKLLLTPNDWLSVTLGAAFENVETRSTGVTILQYQPDKFAIDNAEWGPGEAKSRQYWAVVDLEFENFAVSYIPALRSWEHEGITFARGGFEVNQISATPKDDFHTQELRFSSNNDSNFQWQTGLMYYNNQLENQNQVTLHPSGDLAFNADTKKETIALGIFAESTWEFVPGTRLTTGLRYDETKVETEQAYTSFLLITQELSGDDGVREFENVTYKLRLEHDLSEDSLIYGLVATGFSPGDTTITTNADFEPEVIELEDETLTSYEIGSKNQFYNNRLQVNGALYYYDYSAFQVANINLAPPGPVRTFTTISIPVVSYGAELELLAQPWESGLLSATFAYTNAQYDGIPEDFERFFSSDDIHGIPPYELSLAYDHSLQLTPESDLSLRGSVRYASSHFVERVEEEQVQYGTNDYAKVGGEAVVDVNATLTLENGKYSISAYVRNLLDNEYKTTIGRGTTIDSAGPDGVVSTAWLNDPRTWGLVLTAHF